MTQAEAPPTLSERLRQLRLGYSDGRVTQGNLAAALGVSVPSISSWESGSSVPPVERLREYALAFAAARTFADDPPRLLDEADLAPAEERRRQDLIDELVRLRDRALRPMDAPAPGTGQLGGRFWYFPDGAPIRIITTPIFKSLAEVVPYADPWHPNYIASFRDMDRDATIDLVGHIRAENPASDVRYMTADRATRDDLTTHVVVLGQTDSMAVADLPRVNRSGTVMQYVLARLEIPIGFRVYSSPDGGKADPEYDGEFVVTCDREGVPRWFDLGTRAEKITGIRPRFRRRDGVRELNEFGYPQLEYDVGLLARKPNELNRSTTVTLCSGVFSRGTLGAVRSLTDPALRSLNERYLLEHFGQLDDFWMLFYVPIFPGVNGLETVTPDLGRPFHRILDSVG